MEREGLVRDVEVEFDGETHRATYFIQGKVIHAMIGEQSMLLPVGRQQPEAMVRSLLLEKLRRTGFRASFASKWYPAPER
jgi:hypothetical protein